MRTSRKIGIVAIAAAVFLLFILAAKDYVGYFYFNKYKEAREQAKSIERSYAELERNLKKAIRSYKNPLFYGKLAELNIEMALAENKFGTEEKRDFYLDEARASLIHQINKNPIDASAYYNLGKVYMLYNFPLLTYSEKGRLYFRRALELKPADKDLNVNIIYIYLTQWELLAESEKSYVFGKLDDMFENNKDFIPQIRNLWDKNFHNTDGLREILSTDKKLWTELNRYF